MFNFHNVSDLVWLADCKETSGSDSMLVEQVHFVQEKGIYIGTLEQWQAYVSRSVNWKWYSYNFLGGGGGHEKW